MKKTLSIIILCLAMALCFTGCDWFREDCEHTYDNACDATCNLCGEERTVTHDFADADCDTPKTCKTCGLAEGSALGHEWTTPDVDLCKVQSTCSRCGATDGENKEHTPAEDDGDCTTEVKCTACGKTTTEASAEHISHGDDGDCTTPIKCVFCEQIILEAKAHNFTDEWKHSETQHWHECQNEGCDITDGKTDHNPNIENATDTVSKKCLDCEYIIEHLHHTCSYTIPGRNDTHHYIMCYCGQYDESSAEAHSAISDNDCTTDDSCSCGYIVTAAKEHTPAEDDGDCTTEVECTECEAIAIEAREHTPGEEDNNCTTALKCAYCEYIFAEAMDHSFSNELGCNETYHYYYCLNDTCLAETNEEEHYGVDDGDCTTWILCECGWLIKEANESHTPADDDGNCLTAITCSVCGTVTTPAKESHTGGMATCTEKAVCTACGTAYGAIDANNHIDENTNHTCDRECGKTDIGTHADSAEDNDHVCDYGCGVILEDHKGGTATCVAQAVCTICGNGYGEPAPNNHASTEFTYTENNDGTHNMLYACCEAVHTENEAHTFDLTTGKCGICDTAMTVIATVTDDTNTYYAVDADTLNQAVTAILETGSGTFTVELPADAEAGMITAIRRAICDTEGVADGSIHLTLKGVTTIPGTTNWDGVAFGPRNAQWDENNVEIVSHEEVTQLASINLPDVTEIGAQAFYLCENLVSVSAPKAQTIGAQAFGYTALTSVEFPELTTIPTDMFSGTWTLSSAKFPKVTTIEQGGLLVGAKFTPENNPTPFPLELTAEGNITFNGSNHFNIASQNYSGKVDLVLCCDKKDAVTFNEDGTATWQVREDLSYTFKSITFKHSYVNGKCTACGEDCTHTGGTATCTTPAVCDDCGASYGAVDTTNHDSSVECVNGFCPNGCYEPATLNAAGYYEIDNAGKLFWFAQQVNVEGNKEIKGIITADIDLENRPWTPIGSTDEENSFRGVFDGQNYTIRGLYVEGTKNGVGFFGEVRTGTVKNFTIYGEVIVNTEVDYVGGVIGSICGVNGETDLERNGAIIQNITSYVNLTPKAHGVGMIGGFVGYANHQSLIEQCAWYGTFDAGEYRVDSGAGGFIGKIQENTSEVTIRNCAAYGTIKTDYVKNSYNNYATIYMGGFLSFSNTGAKTTLENCLFAGRFERGENLTDQAFLGAFGTLRSVNAIKNCYYLGDDGLEAVHSDSNLKPGSDNVEITKVTGEELRNNTIATQLGNYWEQGEHYPVIKK